MRVKPGIPLSAFVSAAIITSALSAQAPDLSQRVRAIHARAITIDSHVDISGAGYATPELDPGVDNPRLKCDLVKMKAGGVKAVFLAVYVGQRPELNADGYKAALDQAMEKFVAIHRLTEQMHPDLCELALSPDDVERIARTGKRAIVIGMENGYPVGEDLTRIKSFYDLGARYITLTHSGHNQLGDSAGPKEPLHDGLSGFGQKVVAEMNRLGMMIDVSHISATAFWDVLKMSRAPIIASHSGCAAINPHDRNLDDEQLRALARNRGVVQIVALGSFLKADSPERAEAVRKLREELGLRRPGGQGQRGQAGPAPTPEERAAQEKARAVFAERMKAIDARLPGATIKDFVDHIDHAVKVAGVDHVGIGTDFDGGGGIPGFNSHADAMNVTNELVRRGYSEQDIRKIWGGNLLRVWREVRKAATAKAATD